jgi:hypothetical protein
MVFALTKANSSGRGRSLIVFACTSSPAGSRWHSARRSTVRCDEWEAEGVAQRPSSAGEDRERVGDRLDSHDFRRSLASFLIIAAAPMLA